MKATMIQIIIGLFGTIPKALVETRRVKNQRMSREHPNFSIVKIGQNTEKCPGDLRRLTVTHSSENYQLMLV